MYVLLLRNREPLSYGEEAVGIKALIKRINILLPERGEVIRIPVILGNGIRGVLRDLMTIVFLEKVAEAAKSKGQKVEVDSRVLLLMLSGGVLTRGGEGRVTAKAIDNLRKEVELLPPLSLMGFALSNVMVPSKIKVSTFYPVCNETFGLIETLVDRVQKSGKASSIDFDKLRLLSVKSIVGEVQMMHKDDLAKLTSFSIENLSIANIEKADTVRGGVVQEKTQDEQEELRARLQALFQREYIVPGTLFIGYISEVVSLTDAERELLALGLRKLEECAGLGGAVARGFGALSLVYTDLDVAQGMNGSKLRSFIEENLDKIIKALKSNPEEWIVEKGGQ